MCGGRNVESLATPPKTALPGLTDTVPSPAASAQSDSAELSSRYSASFDTLAAKFVVHSDDDIKSRIVNNTAKNIKLILFFQNQT